MGWNLPPGVTDADIDRAAGADDYEDDYDPTCPTCRGRGTVNPLTAPLGFFCVGTTDCPSCGGSGEL